MQVLVRDNNVDQALKALKKKMQREGIFREMKLRNYFEKPSERKARERRISHRLRNGNRRHGQPGGQVAAQSGDRIGTQRVERRDAAKDPAARRRLGQEVVRRCAAL